MTLQEEQLLSAIKQAGVNGITAIELSERMEVTSRKVWSLFQNLQARELVFCKKVNSIFKMYAVEYKTKEEKSMTKNEMNWELSNLLIETMAKFATDKVVEKVMPLVEKKCVEEFGMLPVVHEIRITNQEPVQLKCELPPAFNSILAYAVNGNPTMMTGPAGTGKGFLARQVALATDALFYEVNAVKNSYDLTGFVDANSRFVRTPFYDACKASAEGKKAVFLFDEMDCSEPEVLKIFNEALASKEFTFPNDEHLVFDNLIILCACNTFGTGQDEMYCGQQLDASTLDRFVMVRVDYNRKVEMSLSGGDEQLVDFIDMFRKQTEKNGLNFVASYRSIVRINSMRGVMPLKQVMKECFIKSMADDDLKNILNNLSDSMADNPYFQASKGKNVKYPEKIEQPELELTA